MEQKRYSRRGFMGIAAAGAVTGALTAAPAVPQVRRTPKRPNVLFIAVDDLRPQLGCYGHEQMLSPNIDRLASEGMLFRRTFCQVPVCGASRASLLTGIRPTRHRFIDYYARADEDVPGAVSLPKRFRDSGWHTVSNGKVYHHLNDDIGAWSEKPWRPSGEWTGRGYLDGKNQATAAERNGSGPAYEKADVPDSAYQDGKIADKAIADLKRLAGEDGPFFLAAGFMKPHLPFNAPSKYWDMYRREDIDLADNPFRPKGAPDAALHNWVELRRYYGIPEEGPLSDELAQTLVHGYYACVSYTDAQIGRVLAELDRLRLRDNTIVVLWGDHGWQLGEHGLWCKHCNFETSLHSPLIVRAPGLVGGRATDALTEFVDIYPSLCDLAGLASPSHLEGTSFVPLMQDPARQWKRAAFSRYVNGDSIRTDRYRYTEWTEEKIPPGSPLETRHYARMLYDHESDPNENVNIAERPDKSDTVTELAGMLKAGWKAVQP